MGDDSYYFKSYKFICHNVIAIIKLHARFSFQSYMINTWFWIYFYFFMLNNIFLFIIIDYHNVNLEVIY